MNKLLSLAAIPLLLSSLPAIAAESEGAGLDFLVLFKQCKATFAPLHMVDQPVVTAEGDPVGLGCVRSDGKMHCLLEVADESTPQVYDIAIDTPPLLAFRTEGGGDFVTIHTTNHVAVLSSRLASTEMLGAKICHGTYMTASELEHMRSLQDEPDTE